MYYIYTVLALVLLIECHLVLKLKENLGAGVAGEEDHTRFVSSIGDGLRDKGFCNCLWDAYTC
jgi:hypothetical protein